jgi:glycerol kinase|eukprot:scaffold15482_cov207-Alexandrium_tamarense.AAC.1
MEASCYQTKEVFDAITNDSGVTISSLNVDGGATANKLMMQFQADMLDVPVVKPLVMETTALGAAFAAGLAVNVWKDLDEIKALWTITETFEPSMDESKRAKNWKGWNKAVQRSFDWIDEDGDVDTED